ncbi:MAG: DUF2254 domain-containing protein [Chloroflexales bacterium]|nr:DUF2254 domain-containing protein [Chloroflexales bacterium]
MKNDLVLRMIHRPGRFIISSDAIVLVWPAERVDDEAAAAINKCFILGRHRSAVQDVEYAIDQLVEIIMWAFSPGINDLLTAINCIDWLGVALCRLACLPFPKSWYADDNGNLRLIVNPVTFADITDAAFNLICQNARSEASVAIRLLEAIGMIARHVEDDAYRDALRRHLIMIERGSRATLPEEWDREDLTQRYQMALQALDKEAFSTSAD